MGQHTAYMRIHTFSEDDTEGDQRSIFSRWKWMSCRRRILFATITIMLLLSASCAFYFWHLLSKSGIQQTESQAQLQNQTTQEQVTLNAFKICTETLKKGCNKAKDSNDLRAQLVTTKQSLNRALQRRDSCQKELNTLNDSIRIQTKQQEAEKHKLQGCQAQVQNQSAQVQAQAALKTSTEALKKDLEKAKKAGDDLRAQLATANQNLDNTHQHWDSCQKELNTLLISVRIQTKQQEAEKHKLQDQITSLQQQLYDQSQEISKMESEMEQEPPESSGAIICDLGITLLLPLLALLLV